MFKKKKLLMYCYDCGCVLQHVSKSIPVNGFTVDSGPYYFTSCNKTRTYCGKCAPPYDIIHPDAKLVNTFWETIERYYKHQPDIEVTKEGKSIKK